MELQKLEQRIQVLNSKVTDIKDRASELKKKETQHEWEAALRLREVRKKLKRTQRRANVLEARVLHIKEHARKNHKKMETG